MMLKVVHLNTYDGNGGAGRACIRLNQALLSQGADSKIIVHYKFGNDAKIQTFNKNPLQKAYAAAKIVAERILAKAYLKPTKTPFSFAWFGRSVIEHKDVKEADIIHLHWVNHSFLSPSCIARIAKLKKPVVWTFHDSNTFTGGCHVRYGCDNFRRECGYCPLLKSPGVNDISHKIWEQKQKAYNQLDFKIIAPSLWMRDSVTSSSLMAGKQVINIANTIETAVFKPIEKRTAREQLGLQLDKFIFLTGFMPSRKDMHKGGDYLLKSLEILSKKQGIDKEQIELVVFGNRNSTKLPDFPFKTTFLGKINNDEKLVQCYAAADAFLIPSLEDNLPYTVMESLACGTPVVAFTTGGIPDMVQHQVNGYLAGYRFTEDFANGMEWIINHADRDSLSKNARETIMSQFSEQIIAEKHLEVYRQLLQK